MPDPTQTAACPNCGGNSYVLCPICEPDLPDTTAAIGDVTRQVMDRLMAWKEALLTRMLRHWNPAWGMPTLVDGPVDAKVPLYDTLRMPWEQNPTSASVSVLGLARGAAIGEFPILRVRAVDHIGPDNRPLLPEGPWPLPDNAQWQAWREMEDSRMSDDSTTARSRAGRATKDEVLARLDEARVALVGAADAMARRFGSCRQVVQAIGAAHMIASDWMPEIRSDKSDD